MGLRLNFKPKKNKMKTTKNAITFLTVVILIACSKDDSHTPETSVNKAPGAFNLTSVADDSEGIDLKPTFTWNAAADPEGDTVTYDFYLDGQEDPATLVAANLIGPTFTITDSLHLVTNYQWKVIAKDAKGASVSSTINTFTTRTLNFPDDPITDNADFSERYGHSMVAFNGSLWIIGGYVDGEYTNHVWQSRNGESWRKVTPDYYVRDLFQKRGFHTTVVFDNKLWVIGGIGVDGFRNDVWNSSNGISWTEVTPNASFSPVGHHTAVGFHNKLWVIGGIGASTSPTNDVWSSIDGIAWTPETLNANFPNRSNHATVVFHDKLWVLGGQDRDDVELNDIWSSYDGKNWTEVVSNVELPSFSSDSSVVFDDKIMILGFESNDYYNRDIWYSIDGKNWRVMAPKSWNVYFPELFDPIATVFHDKIWFNNSQSKAIWALD